MQHHSVHKIEINFVSLTIDTFIHDMCTPNIYYLVEFSLFYISCIMLLLIYSVNNETISELLFLHRKTLRGQACLDAEE